MNGAGQVFACCSSPGSSAFSKPLLTPPHHLNLPTLHTAGPELAAVAVSKLEQALREIEVTGAADYITHHAAPPRPHRSRRQSELVEPGSAVKADPSESAAAGQDNHQGTQDREASAEPVEASQQAARAGEGMHPARQPTDAVRDLDRWGWLAGWLAGGGLVGWLLLSVWCLPACSQPAAGPACYQRCRA